MKGLNYLVLIFMGFILLANFCFLIQIIYKLIIGQATINKNAFKIPTKKKNYGGKNYNTKII